MEKSIQIGSLVIQNTPVPPLNIDDRGWIITTGKGESEDPVSHYQPRIISTSAGQTRGNHFHQEETETIIFLNGIWEAFFADSRGHFPQKTTIDSRVSPQKIIIPPLVAHAFTNRWDNTSIMFHYSDKPYVKNRSIQLVLTKGDI